MTLRVRYNRVTTAGGVEPDTVTVRAGVAFTSAAEEGSVGTSEIVVDDPSNALNYVGRRRLYAYETAAPAHNQMIYNGYIQNRKIGRMPAEGPDNDVEVMGRRWTLSVADTNSLLSRRLITGADGDRPAETDVARIGWLLDSNDAYLSNPQDTWENPSPYVDTSGPVSMSANDYRGSRAYDVLNDCAQRSGKNWFARYYEANDSVPPTNAGSIALTYAFATASSDTSSLRLTNVRADVDNTTTFGVLIDMLLDRDPTRAASGILLTYDGGSRYQQSTNVVNLFQRFDVAVNNPYVKTDTEAAALATRYLGDAATEADRITAKFVVPKQNVNDLREGQRFEAKFSHLDTDEATYSTYAWWRCLRRTVTHLNDEEYEIAIEATPIATCATIVQTVSSGYSSVDTPLIDAAAGWVAPTAGNHLVVMISRKGAFNGTELVPHNVADTQDYPLTQFGAAVDFAPAGGSDAVIAWRVATGAEVAMTWDQNQQSVTVFEVEGGDWGSFTVQREPGAGDTAHAVLPSVGTTGQLCFSLFISETRYPGWVAPVADTGWTADDAHGSNVVGGAVSEPYIQHMHGTGSIVPGVVLSPATTWGAMAVAIEGCS